MLTTSTDCVHEYENTRQLAYWVFYWWMCKNCGHKQIADVMGLTVEQFKANR